MAKQGQHKNDAFDQTKSPGHNHPGRSQTITTGQPKKPSSIERDARQHRDPYTPAQHRKNEWDERRKDPSYRHDGQRRSDELDPMGEQVRGMPDHRVLPGDQHPERYRPDLNPNPMAGQNHGPLKTGEIGRPASDIKDVQQTWSGLSDADLKQLPVIAEGTRLQQGGVYFDLNDPARGEIEAMGSMQAGPGNRYVAKTAVDYQLWNALIGVQNPERLGRADEV